MLCFFCSCLSINNLLVILIFRFFFFFNDTATTEIYTLSLHDALPICRGRRTAQGTTVACAGARPARGPDRKRTRLNSSHDQISYAVFCLKKNKTNTKNSFKNTTKKRKNRSFTQIQEN